MVKQVPKPTMDDSSNKGIGGRGGKSPKDSGTYFERSVQKQFGEQEAVSFAKRIVGSGAFGTITRNANLFGDVHIEYKVLDRPILAECKFGYGGQKQLTVKKEWIEKIIAEAILANKYPALIVKFKGSRGPASKLIMFTWETWNEMLDRLTKTMEFLNREYTNENGRSEGGDEGTFGI